MTAEMGNGQSGCPQCAKRDQRIADLEARLAQIEAELAKARKHSGNSSKPPSSDIVSPPAKRTGKVGRPRRRKRGGQPGHPRHLRPPFEPESIDQIVEYRYDACPGCGGRLQDAKQPPKIQQHVELAAKPVVIEEHRQIAQFCRRCQEVFYHPLGVALEKAGLCGPQLTALVGFFKSACHMSFSTIRKFFRDVMEVPISRGQLAKLIGKVSASVEPAYADLLDRLPSEGRINVDETGHKDSGKRLWTWCFRAALYTVFKVSPSRGSDVLLEVLGREFSGLLGCDYFSAYRKYARLNENVLLQFCLAHFIRDVKFLVEHPNPRNRTYGQRLLGHLKKLFATIHRREAFASDATFRRALERIECDLVWDATAESPHTTEARNLEERFYRHTESYFRFIAQPDIEPTNNLAEQVLRFVAIHRRITQGTRGEAGQRWWERMCTVIATCAQQSRSAFHFLREAVTQHLAAKPSPLLAPLGP
jgi:transposase